MAVRLGAIADRLFAEVMAPLVLGGALRPGHAIGARRALAFGDGCFPEDAPLALRVRVARVRCARALAPVDALPEAGAADWALAAALNDVLQSVSPEYCTALRRRMGGRILDAAVD